MEDNLIADLIAAIEAARADEGGQLVANLMVAGLLKGLGERYNNRRCRVLHEHTFTG
jgi:hypothetical protein